jgi:prepilin-type processing-associated H-X9-DG protein
MLVSITSFVEQQAIWEQISNPMVGRTDGSTTTTPGTAAVPWVAFGPTPENVNYIPWATEIKTYRCPSDPGFGLPSLGRTNYVACVGDSNQTSDTGPYDNAAPFAKTSATFEAARAGSRGFFMPKVATSFGDCLDGLSNTIAMGEVATDLGDEDNRTKISNVPLASLNPTQPRQNPSVCLDNGTWINPARPRFWADAFQGATVLGGRGYRWADHLPLFGSFITVLPPNREVCVANNGISTAAPATASSRHQGGCHVLMGDGAVKFVTDSIEAGNSRAGMIFGTPPGPFWAPQSPGLPSPYGLWGKLGTRAMREVIVHDF